MDFDPPTRLGPPADPGSRRDPFDDPPTRLVPRPPGAGPASEAGPKAEAEDRAPPSPFVKPIPSDPSEILLCAASPLLVLVAQLRERVVVEETGRLKTEAIAALNAFEAAAREALGESEDLVSARYVLCSLIDEAVMTAEWGGAGDWSANSLLNRFHGETWGGQKVFDILESCRAEPRRHLALLRLIEAALTLGFEGRFRILEGGRDQLADLRADLRAAIRPWIGPVPHELSGEWRGVARETGLRRYPPLWFLFGAAALTLVCAYAGLSWRLDLESAPVLERIAALQAAVTATRREGGPTAPSPDASSPDPAAPRPARIVPLPGAPRP